MQYKLRNAVKSSENGVLIDIHVVSQSRKISISFNGWEPRIKLKVKNPPLKGRANEEIKRFFKKAFKSCEIISGFLSPKKTLLIENCDELEVTKKLEKMLEKDI